MKARLALLTPLVVAGLALAPFRAQAHVLTCHSTRLLAAKMTAELITPYTTATLSSCTLGRLFRIGTTSHRHLVVWTVHETFTDPASGGVALNCVSRMTIRAGLHGLAGDPGQPHCTP
jgi:hypothetical protein